MALFPIKHFKIIEPQQSRRVPLRASDVDVYPRARLYHTACVLVTVIQRGRVPENGDYVVEVFVDQLRPLPKYVEIVIVGYLLLRREARPSAVDEQEVSAVYRVGSVSGRVLKKLHQIAERPGLLA